MKNYAVILVILLCPYFPAKANIINRYYIEKLKLEKNIEHCRALLEEAETDKSRKQIIKDLKRLNSAYKTVVRKYTDTEKLLSLVRQIDPQLYDAVAKVTNAEGTLTHVYVRCVSRFDKEFAHYVKHHFNAEAYTSVCQARNNEHECRSVYGGNTITITIAKNESKIKALAHEFAHVLYIVPNLKTYTAFINNITNSQNSRQFGRGHHPDDPSIKFVQSIEHNFKDKYVTFLKNPENQMALNF